MSTTYQKVSSTGALSPATWTDVANPTVGVVGPTPNLIRFGGTLLLGYLLGRS